MKFIILSFILVAFNALGSSNTQMLSDIDKLSRFAIGSCNKEYKEQVVWPGLLRDKPQLFVWGGDNIYGDQEPNKNNFAVKYVIQNNNEQYQKLKAVTPILGIWDDHDYGDNDAGAENPKKIENKKLLLDFLEVPKDAPVRSHDGIYQTYTFGRGETESRFIMIDNRYNLTETEIMGASQWRWLEETLKASTAKVHFIVGGLAIIGPKVIRSTQWANYRSEQKKLISLLEKYKTPGVVFLTGDKHFSAVTEAFGFVEIMTSGMTHTKKNFFVRNALKLLYQKTFFKRSYAVIDIDWDAKPLTLKLKYQGVKSKKEALFEMNEKKQFTLL